MEFLETTQSKMHLVLLHHENLLKQPNSVSNQSSWKQGKKQQAFSNTQLFLKFIFFPRQDFFFFFCFPQPLFSFQRPINTFECVSRCVPAGEVAAAMAGTSRRKKKKKEKKKSKWEMVQRQTESNNATTTTTTIVQTQFVLCGHEDYQLTTTPLKSNRR